MARRLVQVATNALLERQGERTALLVTQGFADLLLIGNQTRSKIFELDIQRPELLYEMVAELPEDVILPLGSEANMRNGASPQPCAIQLASRCSPCLGCVMAKRHPLCRSAGDDESTVTTLTGERVCVRAPLKESAVREALERVKASGIKSIAVVLKHAALFPDHEELVGKVAAEMGFAHVSLSHKVMKMVKMVPRGFTAAADAYLTPHIVQYLRTFQSGFDAGLERVELSFMQSDGGLSPADAFSGHKAILSGPAAGYVGYAVTTTWDGMDTSKPLQVRGAAVAGARTCMSGWSTIGTSVGLKERISHVFDPVAGHRFRHGRHLHRRLPLRWHL